MMLSLHWYWFVAPLVLLAAASYFFWRVGRKHQPQSKLRIAQQIFQQQRTQLERLFFEAASHSGKPRGLRWKECQWESETEWVRDRQSGQFLALVGITISFEAIEGGDMEGVAAVSNLRNATAVFFFQDDQWRTVGRAIFNLNPDEAVQHFQKEYERY